MSQVSTLDILALRPISAPGMKPVLHFIGLALMATAGMMLFPLLVDVWSGHPDWRAFALAAALAGVTGALCAAFSRGSLHAGLTLRQAFIVTPMSWAAVTAFGALPFYLGDYGSVSGNITNSVFETISGLTTTGSTVISGLDDAPPGMLLWRGLLQWMGGIGIIAAAIAILPALGIGGMQLFRTESSDRSEKAMPRVRQIAAAIGLVYVSLTVTGAFIYWLLGMTPFEAIVHALTSISTGGNSTTDRSFAAWEDNGIQWFATLFMLAGSLPFILYVRFVAGDTRAFFDRQVKSYLSVLALVIGGLGLGLVLTGQYGVEAGFRQAAFNVVSVVTTTGYASTDYTLWGNAAVGIFFGLTFLGGCTGSTSGGIKIFRFEILAIMLKAHFMRLLYPRGVFPPAYGGKLIDEEVIGSVVAFFSVFFISYSGLTILLMALGLDFLTSASGAVTALSNVGPGLGPIIGPAGNFAPLPDGAKWLLSFAMMLGRLELFTVLVLFVPRFWRG